MSNPSSKVSWSVRAALLASAASIVVLAPAGQAQQSNATVSEGDLAEVVVTGSRIRRAASLETLEPSLVISSEYLEERGLLNVADALNELVSYGVGTTPEGGQAGFGTGVNFVNRFSLGSARTLTLVNGRRFVSSNPPTLFGPAGPGLQVDLNAIPTVLIDRVESIAIGGAPTYGSDAISGTVNLILKDKYEGFRVFGQLGDTFQRDAGSGSLGLVGGMNFMDGRANVTFSYQHTKQDGLLASERPRFAEAYFLSPNPSAAAVAAAQPGRSPTTDGRINGSVPFNTSSADGIPNNVYIRDRRIGLITKGGLLLPVALGFDATGKVLGFGAARNVYLQFNRNGELVPYNTGTNFGQVDYSGGDGLNLVDAGQITSDVKRDVFNLLSNVDLSDTTNLFFEGIAYKGEALELTDQWAYQSALFGGESASVVIPSTHALLTTQARNTLAANGITSFRLERAHSDLATNNGRGETELYRGVVGLRGEFDAADRKFDWEVSANFGRSKATSFSQQLDSQKFINALNVVVNANGQVVCNPAGTIRISGQGPIADPACVPIDIFGEQRPSAAARAYVSSLQRVESVLEQTVFNANIGGQLFDTWAGPVAFNVGYEQREEKGSFVPDAYLQAGTGRSVPITPTAGSFDTKEFFGETIIPLVAPANEIPLVRRVNLVGKARYVDNTVNGGFTASTFGLQYQPIADIEVRGNVTRSLRAPSIVELFLPQAGLFSFINHPCDSRAITAPGTTRATNCESFFRQYGITPPFTFTAWSASTQGTTAGNPSLLNEVAESWTAGVVFRPSAVPGLQMAADWIDIDITKVITSLSATQLAVACFDSTAYPNNPFCPRIQYTANGQAAGFQAGFVNGNALTVSGLVANVEYGFNLADLGFSANAGRLRARLDWYYEDAAYQVTAVGARTDFPGTVGEPRNQVVLGVNYLRGPFTFFWQTQYQSSVVFSRTDTAESRDILQLGDYYLHNASVAFQLPSKKTTLRLALSNVLDDAAPFPITGTGAYDILGRRLSLSFTHDF